MQALVIAAFMVLVSRTARVAVIVEGATCNSVDVTDPMSSTDSSMGWVSEAVGAGERRQGHITAEVEAWDQAYLVIYGGTSVRNDDVNGISARGSSLWILDNENPRNWTELEMIGKKTLTFVAKILLRWKQLVGSIPFFIVLPGKEASTQGKLLDAF